MRASLRFLVAAALIAAVTSAAIAVQSQTRQVDDATLVQPPAEDWVSYGRDYAETHHSPLTQVAAANVDALEVGLVHRSRIAGQGRDDARRLGRRALRHVHRGASCSRSTRGPARCKWKWDPALVRGGSRRGRRRASAADR